MKAPGSAFVLLCTLLAAGSFAGCGGEAPSCCSGATTTESGAEVPADVGMSLHQLDHALVDAAGRTRRLADFAGRPTLVAMVFTRCAFACPAIVSDLRRIVDDPAIPPSLQVALLSMDVARDDPAALAAFAADHGLDPARFTLLRGDQTAVDEFAAVLGVRIAKVANGDFSHSNQIALLDGRGVIRFRLQGLGADPAPLFAALAELAAH